MNRNQINQSRVYLSRVYLFRVYLFTAILLMLCGTTFAIPKLGSSLPAHPWQENTLQKGPENTLETSSENTRYWVALYSHDCGDMGEVWNALLAQNLPIQAVNAEETYSAAPKSLEASKNVWRGPQATQFSRALKVRVYPTVLLIEGERIVGLWEPTSGTSFLDYVTKMVLK